VRSYLREILDTPPADEITFEGDQARELAELLRDADAIAPAFDPHIVDAARIRISPQVFRTHEERRKWLDETPGEILGYAIERIWKWEP
jgi:hypothetical protein